MSAGQLGPANQARRDARTERLADEIVGRLPDMPGALLAALAGMVYAEVQRRRAAGR